MEPLTVQPGLPYINDEVGPTMELLCNVKIIPDTIDMRPTTINDQLVRFFSDIAEYILTKPKRTTFKAVTIHSHYRNLL
jgi:hypothetical protein